jgi:hypothetical protein
VYSSGVGWRREQAAGMACCDLPAVGFGMERDARESLGKKTLWSGNIWERETINKGEIWRFAM